MKAFEAILVTIGILVVCFVVILATDFFAFFPLVVVGTTIWATIDAKRIQLSKFKVSMPDTPVAVFFTVLVLWIIFFPIYLVSRGKVRSGKVPLRDPNVPLEVAPPKRPLKDIPKGLDIVVKLLWAGLVVSLITVVLIDFKELLTILLDEDFSDVPWWHFKMFNLIYAVLLAGIFLLIIWLLKSGLNWARWTYIVLSVVGSLLYLVFIAEIFSVSALSGIGVLAGIAVSILEIILLVRKDSDEFFKSPYLDA